MSLPRRVFVTGVLIALLLATVPCAWAKETDEADGPDLETATRTSGNPFFAYTIFIVLGGAAVTIVFRGIRAR